MQREDFFYDSRDGENKIHAVRWTPDEGEVKGIFQIVHGMAEYIDRYEDLAAFMTEKGWVVIGEDHLGHGKSIPVGGTPGYFCKVDPATVVVRDVHRLKKLTQEMYPGVPIVLLGHSMGSFIARNYISRYGTGIQAAIIMGTGMQPRGLIKVSKAMVAVQKLFLGEKHVARALNNMGFGAYNKRIENPRTDFDWLSVNQKNVDKYMMDPLCGFVFTLNGFGTLFELIDRLYDKNNLAKVPNDLPLLYVSGAEDPVGDYGKAPGLAMESLKEMGVKDMTVKIYPGDRHEILNEDDKDTVKEDLYQWIMSKV
ncbi:MAG: lysophospholipase [Lachnospiraceae bacterium]|nr:lysophospholipase [Lachnospiraceae bacterium]